MVYYYSIYEFEIMSMPMNMIIMLTTYQLCNGTCKKIHKLPKNTVLLLKEKFIQRLFCYLLRASIPIKMKQRDTTLAIGISTIIATTADTP